ncbi:MAG: glycine--tRNA ligase subunit beta [Deltaproteobacteria bacterium]|nr:glycine--tRNA ligase subunit beta [Deltaproteobacteria bacterium]
MTQKEFILELGTEEIPARMVKTAATDLARHLFEALKEKRLGFSEKDAKTFFTPRRLVVCVPDLDERQEDLDREVVGPPAKIAIGPDGNPTRAGENFARTNNVAFDKIGRKQTPKGEVLCVRVFEKGRPAREILSEICPAAIAALKFKKSMRWGDYDAFFVRPIRWICAVFGGEVVPFVYGAVKSGGVTFGLRIHPDTIRVADFHHYLQTLSGQGVIVDPEMRKKWIAQELKNVADRAGGQFERDQALLDEVTNLVECPVAFLGTFDREFLELPPELLRVTMKHHQRYFPVMKDGRLTNHFVGVSNTPVKDQAVVTAGNERVLRARLKDAKFFFDEDRKQPLEEYVEKLKGVVFQAKLGTYFDKKERVKAVAAHIASALQPGDASFARAVERAAELCKADLVTGMVGEFPELQGVIGRYYAAHAREPAAVAMAILEHYMPTGGAGDLPPSGVGAALSIADKLDTIAGCYSAGLKPTGSADPYALRRAALGIVRISIDRKWPLDLDAAIGAALEPFGRSGGEKAGSVALRAEINAFFKSRVRALFAEEARLDVVDAFLDARATVTDVHDLRLRFDAFKTFQGEDYFEDFATAFKRAQNITKAVPADRVPDPALFSEAQETDLQRTHAAIRAEVDALARERRYLDAMRKIGSTILGPIHVFFEKVYVEVDDEKVRNNRKALLKQIVLLFADFADFSRMEFRAGKKD